MLSQRLFESVLQASMIPKDYPIYLVSLQQDEVRRREMAERFPSYFPLMTHIKAVDGRRINASEFFDYIALPLAEGRRLMLPGEVGCSLSHMLALNTFLESGKAAALILEDDVLGSDSSIREIIELIPLIKTEGILICGGQDGMPARKYIFGERVGVKKLYKLAPFSHQYIHRTCCYVVTRQSAARILQVQAESLSLADAWSRFFPDAMFDVYYSRKLFHPEELKTSHLEDQRAQLAHRSALGRRGVLPMMSRRASRIIRKIGALICLLKGYRRVANKG